jgi:transposase
MRPYCQDLRNRVVAKAQAGKLTQAAVAATFGVSLSTVEKWLHRKRETGKIAPLPPAHGPKRLLQDHASLIRTHVKQQPDITLAELCGRIVTDSGIGISPSTMCRELQRLRLPRKKVTP